MPIPTQSTAVEAGRLLLADVVHDRLLAVIVSGDLSPGEVVREEEIGEWLGVSRTPVRDAMRRLGEQGLLVYQPNRGSRVAPLDRTQLCQVIEVTAALYGMAARLTVARADEHGLASLQDEVARIAESHQGDGSHRVGPVRALLQDVVLRCGNPVLARTIDQLEPHLRRLHGMCATYRSSPELRERSDALAAALASGTAETVGHELQALCLQVGRGLLASATAAGIAS